uniref:Uncharacterized protein n=1 Tax=Heterorhabditis bacteriophora TaxID=37862 RepID=A0A1I7XQZ3_HETBA
MNEVLITIIVLRLNKSSHTYSINLFYDIFATYIYIDNLIKAFITNSHNLRVHISNISVNKFDPKKKLFTPLIWSKISDMHGSVQQTNIIIEVSSK